MSFKIIFFKGQWEENEIGTQGEKKNSIQFLKLLLAN